MVPVGMVMLFILIMIGGNVIKLNGSMHLNLH